jgi:hypothetical protein
LLASARGQAVPIEAQDARIGVLEGRLSALEARLAGSSRNSSRLSFSDGPGGQRGHKGATLERVAPTTFGVLMSGRRREWRDRVAP